MGTRDEISNEDLAAELQRRPLASESMAIKIDADPATLDTPNLDGNERRMIMKVLSQTNGHQQRAAELLGISRRTLSRKLKIYETEAARQSCAS